MGIQEEIKQSEFRNSYQKLAINIIYTHHWLVQHSLDFLKGEKLTRQQYNVLRILRGSHPEPLSTHEIRERMLDKNSDSSRIVDRLVKKGLVKKKPSSSDRRLVENAITPEGLKKLANIDAKEKEMDAALSGLSEDEADQLNDLLDKLRQNSDQ